MRVPSAANAFAVDSAMISSARSGLLASAVSREACRPSGSIARMRALFVHYVRVMSTSRTAATSAKIARGACSTL